MKKLFALLLALVMILSLAACGDKGESAPPTEPDKEGAEPAKEGKVFNIHAWNEEFKGFFEKYYQVPEGITVNWIITPSADGAYQDKLDAALMSQSGAATMTRWICSWQKPITSSSTPTAMPPRISPHWVLPTSPTPIPIRSRLLPTLAAW